MEKGNEINLTFLKIGTAIWHPRCGPGPSENGLVFNGSTTAAEVDRISNSASEIQVSTHVCVCVCFYDKVSINFFFYFEKIYIEAIKLLPHYHFAV